MYYITSPGYVHFDNLFKAKIHVNPQECRTQPKAEDEMIVSKYTYVVL